MNIDWRPVVGFESHYEVSSAGDVRRMIGGQGARSGRVLSRYAQRDGYRFVHLSVGDKKTQFSVHRIVALAFIGPPPFEGAVVNHRDGNKRNNAADNLEWCSLADNNRHARDIGLTRKPRPLRGEENGRSVLTARQVEVIRRLKGVVGQRDLAVLVGVNRTVIQRIHQGKQWPTDLRVREFPTNHDQGRKP